MVSKMFAYYSKVPVIMGTGYYIAIIPGGQRAQLSKGETVCVPHLGESPHQFPVVFGKNFWPMEPELMRDRTCMNRAPDVGRQCERAVHATQPVDNFSWQLYQSGCLEVHSPKFHMTIDLPKRFI